MRHESLIPYISTHLRVTGRYVDTTVGKSYKILEWKDSTGRCAYSLKDDLGDLRTWYFDQNDPYVLDNSFSAKLEEILK